LSDHRYLAGWATFGRTGPTTGAFNRSALYSFLQRINAYLVRWLSKKYRRLRGFKKVKAFWDAITTRCPRLFAHWAWIRTFW